jgi:ribonuclease P protein component
LEEKPVFGKNERICLKKEIDSLFQTGKSLAVPPLRVIYVRQKPASGATAAVMVCLSRKNFRKAVLRNRVKRLIREAYRLNKQLLLPALREKNTPLLIAFLFMGNNLPDWKTVERAMTRALVLLAKV